MNPQKTQVHLAKELTLNQLLGTISPILYESIDFVGQKSLTNFPLSILLVIISNHFPFFVETIRWPTSITPIKEF